ncbi:hypothetical protein C8J57DRAFT_1732377 [Mycena rebaudengoi]|nr:hypothetical protein C8J57DRAFT_1732377 [Mycena rebaudengoi]
MTGVHLILLLPTLHMLTLDLAYIGWPPLSHALLYRSQQMHKRRLPAEDDKLTARRPGFQPRPMQANKTASQPSTRALLTSKCTASCDFPSRHIRTLDAAPMLQDTPSH